MVNLIVFRGFLIILGPFPIAINKEVKSDEEKYRVLVNAFRPDSSYHFPSQEEYRAFQSAWLELYSWLSYSPFFNGGFCVPFLSRSN